MHSGYVCFPRNWNPKTKQAFIVNLSISISITDLFPSYFPLILDPSHLRHGSAYSSLLVLFPFKSHGHFLSDVAAAVLDSDNVWVAGQTGDHLHGNVNVGVGGHAVEDDRDRTGVGHGREVLLEGGRAHLVLEVAGRDHHSRVLITDSCKKQ